MSPENPVYGFMHIVLCLRICLACVLPCVSFTCYLLLGGIHIKKVPSALMCNVLESVNRNLFSCMHLCLQRDGCPKIVNLGSAKSDLFYARKQFGAKRN